MLRYETRHLLTGTELSRSELQGLLSLADELKEERKKLHFRPWLDGKTLALLFEKPSLRTRVSFTVAMKELGGEVVESNSITSKKEEPEDVVRVLGGYVHGVMVRTHEHKILERMVSKAPVPIVNGLSDDHHPCQVFADALTLKQKFGALEGLKLAYIGDGNNMLHSLALILPYLGVHLTYATPKGYEPSALTLRKARARAKEGGGSITVCPDPQTAVKGVNAIYTDVWTSMGFEDQKLEREKSFNGYQLNRELYELAAPGAITLHCLPMIRGMEITSEMADGPMSALFQQSENRLHAQKALLIGLL